MLSAVHTDRTGRIYVSADYFAAGFDGATTVPLGTAIPLPAEANLVPLTATALGFDRSGRERTLGRERWAVGAILPPGHIRTLHPAYQPSAEVGAPQPWAAVGADRSGQLLAAAVVADAGAAAEVVPPVEPERIALMLGAHAGNSLVRQLARCAREYRCAGAAAVFRGTGDGSLPIGGDAADLEARRGVERASPTDAAAFRPTAAEIATVAVAHLRAAGGAVSFGRACDGEPLVHARLLEDAIARIRQATPLGIIHLETDGLHPQALRRLLQAGLGAVSVRLDEGRWRTRRESLAAAADAGAALAACLPVFPGRTDSVQAVEALLELLATLPGGTLVLRDRAGDPHADVAVHRPIGVAELVGRVRRELPRWRIAAFARPRALSLT